MSFSRAHRRLHDRGWTGGPVFVTPGFLPQLVPWAVSPCRHVLQKWCASQCAAPAVSLHSDGPCLSQEDVHTLILSGFILLQCLVQGPVHVIQSKFVTKSIYLKVKIYRRARSALPIYTACHLQISSFCWSIPNSSPKPTKSQPQTKTRGRRFN